MLYHCVNYILLPLQSLFNEASSTLFKATGFRAYFKDVTILVPTNWTVPGAEAAKTESYEKVNRAPSANLKNT